MKPRINMLGVITNDLPEMKKFYHKTLGFPILLDMRENYVEFENDGVRFALSTGEVMAEATGDESYLEKHHGHALELAFKVENGEDVDTTVEELRGKGVTIVKEGADMPWGQRTAFFADPDNNIHEIFADLPK